jgi:putative membrane protein
VFSILLVARLVPGVSVDGLTTTLIVALLLGLINITLKPILFVLTLPVTILTLGLFAFVLNALLLWFVASFVEGFHIDGFIPALLGALIISLVTWVGNKVLP